MWPSYPGFDRQFKLVFAFFIIECLGVSETRWYRSLVEGSIEADHYLFSKHEVVQI